MPWKQVKWKCCLHVCQGTKLKYTCQQIDTGSGVGRWPSTDLCHRPRVGEYCASIDMPPPFRSGYYGGRFSCSIFWRSCNPLRIYSLLMYLSSFWNYKLELCASCSMWANLEIWQLAFVPWNEEIIEYTMTLSIPLHTSKVMIPGSLEDLPKKEGTKR